jgi:uncharacterized protein YyaL (SSP411 family)
VEDPALDWIARALVDALSNGEASPSAVLFLLRRYTASGRDDLREAIEVGLTHGLDAIVDERDARQQCQWLGVFAEGAAISDDDRLVGSVQSSLASTIDGLEQLARAAYEPGEGMLGAELHDQLRSASAFLTAFELTGRLPYSMLAEELVQVARRRWWDEARGTFGENFIVNAIATQVLCRLAALHRDPDYTAAAVVSDHQTYLGDAERMLASLEPMARAHLADVAEYGLALLDWFALSELPN